MGGLKTRIKAALFILMSTAVGLGAQETLSSADQFVADNLTATLFHELGHAIIDAELLPVFGQEEDAADVFATVLINEVFRPEAALKIMDAQLDVYRLSMEDTEDAPWDVHGSNEQRYFNAVCIFYGLDTENREAFVQKHNLPEERVESCEEEGQIAYESWSPVISELKNEKKRRLQLDQTNYGSTQITNLAILESYDFLHSEGMWPQGVGLRTGFCDEANAFYDPQTSNITICFELTDDLYRYFEKR